MILTDSTAVCGPADFSLKDEANRKKLKNFIIEQLYPDDPDGWRAALSVFAVPVWNRFETVWYAPQEIVGFAPKIRRFSEYSTVQQNVFKCRLYEVLQDLSSRAGAFTAVTGEQRLLVSCLSDPAGVFGLGRAMYFDPEKDLYVINDRNPVIIRWGVISEGGNPEPLLQKFFSTCGSDNSQEQTASGDDFASEGAKFSSSGSESAAPETEPVCTNNGLDSTASETEPGCTNNGSGSTASEPEPECTFNGSDSAASETEPVGTFNRSVDRNSKPKGKAKVFSSRRLQKEVYYNENITGDAGLQNGLGCIAYTLLIICWMLIICWITYNNIADKPEDISYKSGIGFLIFVLIFFCSIFNNKRRN